MRGWEWNPTPTSGAPGWVEKTDEPKIQSNSFTINYGRNFSYRELWDKRLNLSVGLSSRLFLDLQRYTSSSFTFSINHTMNLSNFLDLTLSTSVNNQYVYRYFRNFWFFKDAPIEILEGSQNNLFLDLINSIRFDNEDLRKISGFKTQGFNIAATHYLGDWTATLSWNMSPERRTSAAGPQEMNNVVSFTLQWIPISEIKSNINYNKKDTPVWRVQGL